MRIIATFIVLTLGAFALACGEATAPSTDNGSTDPSNAANDSKDNTETPKSDDSGDKDASASAEKNIVENASAIKDFSTLVTAVKAADLVETLSGEGPFTVFAPTNAAFEKLPEGTVETLLKPENKDKLKGILTYHVVAGKLDAAAVAKAIKDGEGKAAVKTVNGEELTASLDGEKVVITDAKGGKSTVTATDTMASNGVIHVLDTVIMPSK